MESRVRLANAALVLGRFRRVMVSGAPAWLAAVQALKTRYRVGFFLQQFARRNGGPVRRWALVFAQAPTACRRAG